MIKQYYNLYYQFYKFSILTGERHVPRYSAMLLLTLFNCFNILSLLTIASIITKQPIASFFPKFIYGIFFFLMLSFNVVLFSNKKHNKIVSLFEEKKIRNVFISLCYVFITVGGFILSIWYINKYPIV
jgi:hypothetical protein